MPMGKRPAFDPQGDYVVRSLHGFVFNGDPYKLGDEFPWRELGVTSRKLLNMYNAGMIRLADTKETQSKVERFIFDPAVHALRIVGNRLPRIIDEAGKELYKISRAEGERLEEADEPTAVNEREIRD